jgi:hypothetical protein
MDKKNLKFWDIKYLRSQPFMPFGSMMNAYGQMYQQAPKTLKEFFKDVGEIFEFSQKLIEKTMEDYPEGTPENKKVDFPTKPNEN